jgi:hypothetical protein
VEPGVELALGALHHRPDRPERVVEVQGDGGDRAAQHSGFSTQACSFTACAAAAAGCARSRDGLRRRGERRERFEDQRRGRRNAVGVARRRLDRRRGRRRQRDRDGDGVDVQLDASSASRVDVPARELGRLRTRGTR